jgi:hypothetical protein
LTELQWNNQRTSFPEIRERIEGHLFQCGMAYIIHPRFIKTYRLQGSHKALESVSDCSEISLEQFRYDRDVLYGMMKSVFRKGKARRYVRNHADRHDGIRAFDDIIKEYGLGGIKMS